MYNAGMNVEVGILFALLTGMAFLFFTEKLPVDLTAFLGLVILVLGGFLEPDEAFTGFSSTAVITMLSIFFVSAAMLHTGMADMVAARVHRTIGNKEIPLIVAIMLVAGVLSAFMNNIAACAVLLPAVASIAKKTAISPSRLFMPLSFGAILGGTTTVVGTPPNILASEMLRERGLEGFALFDFTPLGLMLLFGGILFMITIGRKLLPDRDHGHTVSASRDLTRMYQLEKNLFSIKVPFGSDLDGRTLGETRIGSTLGVQVVGILRDGKKHLAPAGNAQLLGGDTLLVHGSHSELENLLRVTGVEIGEAGDDRFSESEGNIRGLTARIQEGSGLIGRTLREIQFRDRYGAMVVGIRRDNVLIDEDLATLALQGRDELLVLGTSAQLENLALEREFVIAGMGRSTFRDLQGHLFLLRVPAQSKMAGLTIAETRMSELVGLTIAGIQKQKGQLVAAEPDSRIEPGDQLLVMGESARIRALLDLGNVELAQDVTESVIMSDDLGIVEATIAPRSGAAGKTIAELRFQELYGLQVLSIWREGEAIHAGLPTIPLKFGDALLLQGPTEKIQLFGQNRDFVTLSASAQVERRTKKAPYAIGALLLMIAFVVTGYQPIHVAAFTAAVMVVLTGAITMEEAYRAVEWRAIFLVAAILPVGIAMERTGAAALMSQGVTDIAGPFGPYAVLAGLLLLSSALSQCLDGAPAVVLLTPVALSTAAALGIEARPIMMGVSLAASAAFMTPFSHKANLLVMGAGGYKVTDYLKVGTPLTIILLVALTFLVPVFFPF